MKDGRPAAFGEIGVHGSAARIVEVNAGEEKVHAAEGLTSLDDDPPAGIWHRLRRLSALRRRTDRLAGEAPLRLTSWR